MKSKKIISYIMISLILMLSITPVKGDVSTAEIKKALGLTDITISDNEFENILNSKVNGYDDLTLRDQARAITIEKNYVESLQKLDLRKTILLLDATKDMVESIDNVGQLGTTEWLGLGGDILRYSIGIPIISISWNNIRLNEMIYGSIPIPGYVPLREAGWSDDEAWNEVYSNSKVYIDENFKTVQEKNFLLELFKHALTLKQNPNYLTEVNDKAKILADIIRERIPESKTSSWMNIFNIITKGIDAIKAFFSIPEAHSAPPTPVVTYTPTITPTPIKTPSSYSGSPLTNSIGIEFVLIPAGEFDMGLPWNEEGRYDSEGPVHHVKISNAFYMGKYEVTQKQWRDVMGSSPSNFKGDNLPVEQVSWNDVQEFIKKLNGKEGINKYRLPSEAEWEYAARSGTTMKYSFGDDESLGDYAWSDNSGSKTHDVGQKKPNPWGLYDMHGNVWEWVQDNWHDNYNDAPTDGSSWERKGSDRVNRGGGWYYNTGGCRSASRGFNGQDTHSNALGFRLLRVS